jgi:hypothetical protein
VATSATKDKVEKITYKLPKSLDMTDKTVKIDVYDEVDALDTAQSVTLTSANHKYKAQFTPDEDGAWRVELYVEDDNTSEKTYEFIRDYSVGNFDTDDVGALTTTVENKVDQIGVIVTDIQNTGGGSDAPMLG